jgi:Putative prokaryotic signal transducing protein
LVGPFRPLSSAFIMGLKMSENEKLIIVFAGYISQASLTQNILEIHGIDSFLKDEIIGTIAPWYAAAGGAGAVKVEVAESDVDRAKAVIKEMSLKEAIGQINILGVASWTCPNCGEKLEAQFNECWSCQTTRP